MRCPRCTGKGIKTNYRPPEGIDPNLREFKCRMCGYTWFQVTGRYERKPKFDEQHFLILGHTKPNH